MTARVTPRQTRSATQIWSRTDWSLLIGGLGLSLIGALLVWSATRHQSGSGYLARHLLNTGIGLGLAAAVTRVDFRGLRAYAPWLISHRSPAWS
jgi:rod shape determining protein RodA